MMDIRLQVKTIKYIEGDVIVEKSLLINRSRAQKTVSAEVHDAFVGKIAAEIGKPIEEAKFHNRPMVDYLDLPNGNRKFFLAAAVVVDSKETVYAVKKGVNVIALYDTQDAAVAHCRREKGTRWVVMHMHESREDDSND